MGISSLRLKGFKSFGRSCGFEFSRKFTAIVGPNGSGKSNILDALKWILGEGSSSGLRITKQSDLLFQGSNSVVQADNAEVLLNLTSGDEKCTLRYPDHIPYYIGINFGNNWADAKADANELPVIMVKRMVQAYDEGWFTIPKHERSFHACQRAIRPKSRMLTRNET